MLFQAVLAAALLVSSCAASSIVHKHPRWTSDAAPAYLLCANAEMYADGMVYYLHPLQSSTQHPIDPSNPVDIDFDSQVSVILFNTTGQNQQGASDALFADNSRANFPLINTNENPKTNFWLTDVQHLTSKIIGSLESYIEDGGFTYVESLDQYWVVSVMNEYGEGPVISLYADPFSKIDAVFTVSWASTSEYSEPYVAADSDNKLIFISMTVVSGEQETGQLMTYDIQRNTTVNNVTCDTNMIIRYSPSRKVLFGAPLALTPIGYYYPTSIVEVDPASCKTRVLIDNLPSDNAGVVLQDAFNDVTGEWYFQWSTYWGKNTSEFISVNVDSKKIAEPVGLLYGSQTLLLGVTTYQAPSDLYRA